MSPRNSRFAIGLPTIYVRPCLLLALFSGSSHGYELLEQVREMGVGNVDAGGLYRTLRAMEEERLVRSWWEPSESGPPRRTYELCEAGRRAYSEAVGELADQADLIHGLLRKFASGTDVSESLQGEIGSLP